LSDAELERTLSQGAADIAAITGVSPTLVRPPFWNYDRRTFAAYQRHGMKVLLTDLSANDGKIWGFNASPRRRENLIRQLSVVRERIALGELPTVDGVIPVVVTFHDINRYTARASARVPADPDGQRPDRRPEDRRRAVLHRSRSTGAGGIGAYRETSE